jgi:hypothetical protein
MSCANMQQGFSVFAAKSDSFDPECESSKFFKIVEYVGKLNFKFLLRIGYLLSYCHLVQTSCIELLSAVSEKKIFYKIPLSRAPEWLESSVGYVRSHLNGIS